MIKNLFFDLDNTLYSYPEISASAIEYSFRKHRRRMKVSREEFLKAYKKSKEEVRRELNHSPDSHDRILYFQRTTENLGLPLTLSLRLYSTYRKQFKKKLKGRPGLKDTFRELKKRSYKITILTNEVLYVQLKKVVKLGILKYVDYFVSSENVGVDKPDRRAFEFALKHSNAKANETLMIGDSENDDILGSKKVKIRSVLFQTRKNQKTGANYKVKNISEILKILDNLNN